MNRLPAMTDEEFAGFIDSKVPDNPAIIKYLITTRNKLKEFKNILVSYSGGSDSDIMLDLCELVKPPTGGGRSCTCFLIRDLNGRLQNVM